MKKDAPKFLCFLILVFLGAAIFARAETLPYKNYTTADGLGHDRVEEIVRDSRGFLWFCTGEGLARFDGYEFKNYTQADGLPHRRVMDLIETRDGKYLVATYAGIAVFNPAGVPRRWNDVAGKQETPPGETEPPMFRVLRPPDAKQDKRSWTVMDLLETRDGRIWAATLDGLYRLEPTGDELVFQRVEAEAWRGKEIEFLNLLEDRFGALWIASGSGLFRQTPDGKIDTLHKLNGGLSMLEDRQGRIWLGGGGGTPGLSVAVFEGAPDKPVMTRAYTTKDGLSANDWMNDILETSDGRILIGIANGLCEFLPEAKEGEPKFRVIAQKEIIALAEDGGGNIWIGTNAHGAFKMSRGGFTLFDETDFPKAGSFAFHSIFTGDGGEIFLPTGTADLVRFDGKKFTALKPKEMTWRSWGWNQIDFRSRRTGEWWFAGGDKVLRYPNVRFEDLPQANPTGIYTFTQPGTTRRNVFFRLFEDSRGDVWMSVLGNRDDTSGISLLRWERVADKLHAYAPEEHRVPYGNGATAFAEDGAGNVWIGFYFGGLVRYRAADGKFQTLAAEDGMPSGIVNAIYRDRAGRIWIATGSNGIVRVDNPTDEKPRLVNLTVAEGLSSNQAACLTEDNFGRVYVGTGRGVTRLEPESGRIKIYSQADGLPDSYARICGRDSAGALWFTQHKMLARLVPKADEAAQPPPVFIGAVRVNGERARKLSELGETSVENLEFTSEQRQVQIDYLALGFGTGETLRYQYKLENAEWSEPSGQRTVNLNLSPGSYHFLVRAVNAEGVTSENPARVSFSIARPFWQRWWFLLLAAFLIGAVVYALYRYRINQIIKLERVRTRIATDLHDDIGSSLSKIAILSEVVRKKNGTEKNDGFEPLEIIANTSREMVDTMSDIVWAINPERDHLSDLIQRMRRFTEEMLDAQDIEYEFENAENLKDIRLGADLRREIYLIFKECVNNLAKHSLATKAEFDIRLENECLIVEIKDNGRGFVAEKLRAETSSAYSADIGDAGLRSFGGNGLRNMRRRAENLGGEFVIDSAPGEGTRITLKIPVGKKLFAV